MVHACDIYYHTVFVGYHELSVEEVEQQAFAKRKMLGNITFVGENVHTHTHTHTQHSTLDN